jgi:hypothetical protein
MWRQFAANGTAFVPTLVTGVIRADPPDVTLARLDNGTIARWQYVPAKTRERWRHQLVQLKQERSMDWAAIQRDDMRNVREMGKTGVTLLAGTDLVLLDANPLVDVRNTTRIRAVVADGRLLTRAELDRILAEAADGDVPSRR